MVVSVSGLALVSKVGLMIVNGGRYGKYKLCLADGSGVISEHTKWQDAVEAKARLTHPEALNYVLSLGYEPEEIRQRLWRALHILSLGYVDEIEPGRDYEVESESEAELFYRVRRPARSSVLECDCPDYWRSYTSGQCQWERYENAVVCKHVLAVLLFEGAYRSDKEGYNALG